MAQKRTLPTKGNTLLQPEHTPQHKLLVERRKLGQTDLKVKPGLHGTSNATKSRNLGAFDYAHLRAPLPKDLKGSGIFPPSQDQPVPESYFLMRRSSDGFVSATGMFKAAFPWASVSEEELERSYIKKLVTTDPEEVAGNIWVPPEHAIDLAVEYGILPWIEALLDNEDIHPDPKKPNVKSPPTFKMPASVARKAGGTGSRKRKESKDLKAPSPGKKDLPSKKDSPTKADAATSPARKIASPRKPRIKKDADAASPKKAKDATKALQNILGDEHASNSAPSDKVRVTIHQAIERDGDVETTHTAVKVDVPKDAPELPLPKDAEGMVELGKEIIQEVTKLETKHAIASTSTGSKRGKRKAEKMLDSGESLTTDIAIADSPAAKRVKTQVLQDEVKREKVKSRALLGLSAVLAAGAVFPYIQPYVTNLF